MNKLKLQRDTLVRLGKQDAARVLGGMQPQPKTNNSGCCASKSGGPCTRSCPNTTNSSCC